MKKDILIIEDEKDICTLLSSMLMEKGYSVKFSNSISEGKNLITQSYPEVLILDINLPDGNGLDAIPELKVLNKNISFIIISAYDSKEEINKADSFEVSSFLKKPFNKEELFKALQS
jgi:DNA-binding NtrC family response regulator